MFRCAKKNNLQSVSSVAKPKPTENCVPQETGLSELEKRLLNIETRLKNFESRFPQESSKSDMVPICRRLVESVTGVVGLKETVTSKRQFMKLVWAFLFCLGSGATLFFIYQTTQEYLDDPTATQVKMEAQLRYKYPSILLCPEQWFDMKKIQTVGISLDALKYSFSYFSKLNTLNVDDISNARDEFLQIYRRQNYTSIIDFYSKISIDLDMIYSNTEFDENSNAVFGIKDETMFQGKGFLSYGICHLYWLRPVEATSQGSVNIQAKITNPTDDLSFGNNWNLYYNADFQLLSSGIPGITLYADYHSMIMITVRKFISINTPTSPCVENKNVAENYSAATCMANCKKKVYKDLIQCQILWSSYAHDVKPPANLCNYVEPLPFKNMSLSTFLKSGNIIEQNANATNSCSLLCLRKCNRTTYQASVQWEKPISDWDTTMHPNTSHVKVSIKHNAIYDGGILTLVEMRTYTFTDWVTNVGGTLGLFIGGTVMTFVQVIMFVVDYVWDKRQRKRVFEL